MPQERRCYALDLVADASLIAAYEARHRPGAVWPGILADLNARGIVAMEIWRFGTRLFMIAECEEVQTPPGNVPPVVQRWEAEMDRYQRRLPGTPEGEKWRPMTCIFNLSEHLATPGS
ncbi:L-rhamnose mutarotase [Swaminathania salitolerans]|uniref:L-fucose mutarotase n=1 Tax=Swaminathania salitolerans TaxID=182838 RepID=A0A511BLU0_9PROT|nr:L-rhamnose mutarotase [Swaminathania salitolerans]GBQ10222.1 hypothetical protein AA21291_0356 [Swaminathania salitolerans LMG 21291]GEL01215.1 L-fucose mutarotase [Swaminathania salitolerans]